MNPAVLRRFIILMTILTIGMALLWAFYSYIKPSEPGDFEVRQGGIHLTNGEWDLALEDFTTALEVSPDHRGAIMGRAIALLQLERMEEARAEFDYLIDFLEKNLEPDDATGRGTLAAAYANRGILHDRMGDYEQALEDYKQSLRVDYGAVEGPGLVDKILHDPNPSTVLKRARYLMEQLALPEDQRLLTVPELDAEQRMHKP